MASLWKGWVELPFWPAKLMILVVVLAVALAITNDAVKGQGWFGPNPQQQIEERLNQQLGKE